MGSLRDWMGSMAGEAVRAAVSGNGFTHTNGHGHGGSGRSRVEALCSEIGWSIDERIGNDGIVLHFRDPIIRVRKIIVSCGSGGELIGISTLSEAALDAGRLPPAATAYLLHRNAELMFPAWQMGVGRDENVRFTLAYCAMAQGLSAGFFKTLCETMVGEARAFDEKMRESGLL